MPGTSGWSGRSRVWPTSLGSDVAEFLELAAEIPIRPEVQEFPLADANVALQELKNRKIRGAKVLRVV